MPSTDLERLERRARRGYEQARLQRALLGVLPVALMVAVVFCLGLHPHPYLMLALGAAVFAFGAALLWFGREPGRAVLPGLLAGLVPLWLALCARHWGHMCTDIECMVICLPVCAVGGVLAGLAVSWYGAFRTRTTWFWVSASSMTMLTAAVGATCAGYRGVLGVAGGYALGIAAGFIFARLRGPRQTPHGLH